jgi:hypothetical protein
MHHAVTGLVLAGALGLCAGGTAATTEPVVSFAAGAIPPNLVRNSIETQVIEHEGKPALRVDFQVTAWPNVFFTAPAGGWDWSAAAGLEAVLYNPTAVAVSCCMRVDNAGADGLSHCNTSAATIPAGATGRLVCRFNTGKDQDYLWGMRGVPLRGPLASGPVLDTTQIVAFQVYLPQPSSAHTLILTEARLFGEGGSLRELVPLPFVDRFGQYRHSQWPGKIATEGDLQAAMAAETAEMASAAALPDRDRYGGWAAGPTLAATGWFRTQRVDGKWWLVTPDGHLFFSVGIDCVGTWERTWVSGREGWFEWLPEAAEPLFGALFAEQSGAHSMADGIGGKGRTFSFYGANLIRKYGAEWETRWRESAYARLRHWGFNTVANWSQADVLGNSPLPFVASGGIWGEVREIEGGKGYWGRMRDVFAESFAVAVDRSLETVTRPYRDNPLCIGYFIDNELSWETVRQGTLASPPDQPARLAFVADLQRKHASLAALNQAWGSTAATWDDLRVPGTVTAACQEDLDAFEYAFARRYFETIAAAIKKHAPHQLYLGCRFASAPPRAVQACTDVVDVVSFNRYETQIGSAGYSLAKPILIGEFHFGALDRGMFHPGLVAATDQEDRAAKYVDYVQAVLAAPAFVGCHWFQFIDEPITGRWFDGENYNIGFLTVTDTPYAELVRGARRVHAEIYTRRAGTP